jgi:protein SCO1/2
MSLRPLAFALALCAAMFPTRSPGHGAEHPVQQQQQAPAAKPERLPIATGAEADAAANQYFTDTELVDQNGKPFRFYSDLIRGKTVLINFAFASCKTACSPITANLARVQKLLGSRVGKDIHMITITVDPANDTPAKLKEFSKRFQAGPGWYFLSGSRANVEAVLKRLGGYTEKPEEHITTVLIGDSVTGTWLKALALSPPENLSYAVEHLNDPSH